MLIRDFANWLASNGKSPAEQALKTDLRVLLNAGIDDKTGTTGSPEEDVWVYLCDLPAFHVIEYGQVMCPPGEEDAWFSTLPNKIKEGLQSAT